MEEYRQDNRVFYILLFFAVILAGFLCKLLSSVFIPVLFAAMLSFILLPLIRKINLKLGIPWFMSSIIVVFLSCVLFIGFSSLLIRSLTMIISEYPKYESKFMSIYQIIARNINLEVDETKSFIENMWTHLKVREYVQKTAVFLSTGVFSFSKNFFLIAFMTTFLLLEMRIMKRKLHYAFSKDKEKASRVAHQIVNETVRYISIKFIISLATGIISFFVTLIAGLDFPVVWGFLAFIMNFIPIFGSIISVGLTTLFAILQLYPSWGSPVVIFILLTSVNITLGNIVEPRIEGKNLGLSPFIILVCLSLWGYLWGFLGMLIAVPITVIIKIICENIDYLQSIAIIMGNKPKHSQNLTETNKTN